MAVVICAGACAVGYVVYRNSLYQTYNRFAYEIGDTALSYVDGNTIADYLVTGETDAAYEEMTRHIRITPSDYAKKLVEYLGETGVVLEKARADFEAGEYQMIRIWEELRKEAPPKLCCHFPGRARTCPG